MKLIDGTLAALQRSLDVRMRRHEVLASNTANADTPGYKARDLDFGKAMSLARRDASLQPASSGRGAALRIPLGDPGTSLPPPAPLPLQAPGSASSIIPSADGRLPIADPSQEGALIPLGGTSAGLDRNSVDLDRTMVAMAENALLYGAAARAASKKLAILRYVASDGNA